MFCRSCKSKKFKKIVFLGKQPISSIFYTSKKYRLKKYSLDLFKCLKCHLVQLGKVAPLKEMYGTTYGYRTGISNLMISHLKKKI